MADWTFDTRTNRYRDPATGRYIAKKVVTGLRDDVVAASAANMDALARQAVSGEITPHEFRLGMQREVRNARGAQYIFGKGGMNAMTTDDFRTLEAGLKEQYGHLAGFVDDLVGDKLSPDQAAARARMYANGGVKEFEQGQAAAWGIDLPVQPADGGTPCLGNCRCSWQIRETDVAIEATWTLGGPDPCPGCAERAQRYAPFVVAKTVPPPAADQPPALSRGPASAGVPGLKRPLGDPMARESAVTGDLGIFDHGARADAIRGFKMAKGQTDELRANAKVVFKGLEAGQKEALKTYTGGSFRPINKYARTGQTGTIPKSSLDDYTGRLEDVFARDDAALTTDVKVWRGAKFKDGRPPELANAQPGDVITDWGFSSTTTKQSLVGQFTEAKGTTDPTVFELLVPKGSKGVYTAPASNYAAEQELLLPRGSSILIHEVKVDSKGVMHVVGEVVQ